MVARRISRDWLLRLAPLIVAGAYILATILLFVAGLIGLQLRSTILLGCYYLAFALGFLGVAIIPILLAIQLIVLAVWYARRRAAGGASAGHVTPGSYSAARRRAD